MVEDLGTIDFDDDDDTDDEAFYVKDGGTDKWLTHDDINKLIAKKNKKIKYLEERLWGKANE